VSGCTATRRPHCLAADVTPQPAPSSSCPECASASTLQGRSSVGQPQRAAAAAAAAIGRVHWIFFLLAFFPLKFCKVLELGPQSGCNMVWLAAASCSRWQVLKTAHTGVTARFTASRLFTACFEGWVLVVRQWCCARGCSCCCCCDCKVVWAEVIPRVPPRARQAGMHGTCRLVMWRRHRCRRCRDFGSCHCYVC
jgi:hypothetical protein